MASLLFLCGLLIAPTLAQDDFGMVQMKLSVPEDCVKRAKEKATGEWVSKTKEEVRDLVKDFIKQCMAPTTTEAPTTEAPKPCTTTEAPAPTEAPTTTEATTTTTPLPDPAADEAEIQAAETDQEVAVASAFVDAEDEKIKFANAKKEAQEAAAEAAEAAAVAKAKAAQAAARLEDAESIGLGAKRLELQVANSRVADLTDRVKLREEALAEAKEKVTTAQTAEEAAKTALAEQVEIALASRQAADEAQDKTNGLYDEYSKESEQARKFEEEVRASETEEMKTELDKFYKAQLAKEELALKTARASNGSTEAAQWRAHAMEAEAGAMHAVWQAMQKKVDASKLSVEASTKELEATQAKLEAAIAAAEEVAATVKEQTRAVYDASANKEKAVEEKRDAAKGVAAEARQAEAVAKAEQTQELEAANAMAKAIDAQMAMDMAAAKLVRK